jgi:hypothetical protein
VLVSLSSLLGEIWLYILQNSKLANHFRVIVQKALHFMHRPLRFEEHKN